LAKRKVDKAADSPKDPKKDLITRARDCFKIATDGDDENRKPALEDLRFLHVPGEGWNADIKKERGDDRPCMEFNKLRVTVKRVVNDMRANRPQGKVRAVEDGDKDTADVMEGLIRNIWNVSDGDTIIDYAAEYQVGAGMGAWRINTKYSTDTVFDQDIVIEPIKNPFTLYADPAAADPIKRDAEYWLLTERISKTAYERRWPQADRSSFEDVSFDDDGEWADEHTVRICEYWYKEPANKTLVLLDNGKTIDKSKWDGTAKIVKERQIKCHKIMMCIVSGDAVLEGPTEWAGTEFPFVQVYGDWLVIDGKVHWYGLTRHSKGAQIAYNYTRTAITETIALAPQSKFWATPEQAKGHTGKWAEAHSKLFPFLLYNPDPKTGGAPPQRMGGPDVPIALIQESQIASEEIKSTSGIFDPSLGQQSNETSGRAIAQRQRQGEIATFNYADNCAKGIRRTYEILIDLVPKVYDTARSVRILGVDGAEKYVKINQPTQDPATGEMVVQNDLSRGKYDVTVTVGPSFSTQRQEATELYTQLGQAVPGVWTVAGDLIFKSMDLPYAEQIAERMKALLPPQIQQTLSEDKPVPPEVQAVMQQAQQAMQMVQQHGQLVQSAQQELEQEKAAVDQGKNEIQQKIAELQTKQAQFEARVAKELANIAMKEAALTVQQAQNDSQDAAGAVEQDRQSLIGEAAQAVQTIQQLALEFGQLAAQITQQIDQRAAVQNAPKRKQIRAKRVNGELIGVMEEFDPEGNVTGSREMKVRRENGELVGEA
jgi:hypothetical protein